MKDQRNASAAPALPGYEEYFKEDPHPAAQPDPEANDYEKGDTSAWAEDPTKGPYPQSGEPALPGYGTENKDHPAAKRAAMEQAVLKKSAKCVRVAQRMLGASAKTADIEEQAVLLMASMDETALDATLAKMGDFIADEDPINDEGDGELAGVRAELEQARAELAAIKAAGSNSDPMFGAKAAEDENKDEDEGKKADMDAITGHDMFDMYDVDGDGFITAEEWGGSPGVFAALDGDADGIISVEEAAMGLGDTFSKFAKRDKILGMDRKALAAIGLGPREMMMLAKMEDEQQGKKAGEVPDAFKKNWDKGDDKGEDKKDDGDKKDEGKKDDDKPDFLKDKEDEGKKKAARLAELRSQRSASAPKKAEDDKPEDKKDEEKPEGEGKKAAEDEKPEEKPEGTDKEACDAGVFSTALDTMGLDDGEPVLTDDDAILDDIFGGGKAAAKKAEDDEKKDEDEPGTDKTAGLRPQPRKPGATVTTIGGMARTASQGGDENLRNLWPSAPDVSEVFGIAKKS